MPKTLQLNSLSPNAHLLKEIFSEIYSFSDATISNLSIETNLFPMLIIYGYDQHFESGTFNILCS